MEHRCLETTFDLKGNPYLIVVNQNSPYVEWDRKKKPGPKIIGRLIEDVSHKKLACQRAILFWDKRVDQK